MYFKRARLAEQAHVRVQSHVDHVRDAALLQQRVHFLGAAGDEIVLGQHEIGIHAIVAIVDRAGDTQARTCSPRQAR